MRIDPMLTCHAKQWFDLVLVHVDQRMLPFEGAWCATDLGGSHLQTKQTQPGLEWLH